MAADARDGRDHLDHLDHLDAHVRAVVQWHFDPGTGSPYWLRKARALDFDPRAAVQGFEDLYRFPAVADEWRDVPARDLIPRGCPGPFAVWETGGTTGMPRRIVDGRERDEMRRAISRSLDEHGLPAGGDWLHLGPTGPHLVGTTVARLAQERGGLRHTVDLDPRWVKRLWREGRHQEVRHYTDHVVGQALTVLQTQPITVLTTTPPLLQALCEHATAGRILMERIRGVIWFGTSLAEEALRLLEEEVLPGVPVVGWYGNTLMGIACQRPRRPGDLHRCVFAVPGPRAVVRVMDPARPDRRVDHGEPGRVCLSVLTRECFLPWHRERDQAVRVPPAHTAWDDVARVAPLDGADPATEGVY